MYYFVSDIHLGGGSAEESKATEARFVKWLDSVGDDAKAIFICGDMFDFWFEYKRVAPKGFVRTLGRIASLTDRGIRVVFMAGNHDQWIRDYLAIECGMEIYTSPHIFDIYGKRVYIAHGDNLNVKSDPLLKLMNSGFRSKWLRVLFSSLVHPDIALKFGQWWSGSSRKKHIRNNHKGCDKAQEMLTEHAEGVHARENTDLHIFGHIHVAVDHTTNSGTRVIFTNDWSQTPYCAIMDESGDIALQKIDI
ncbi:MAG: UDP-2,3-diacylglucosamine diphosphatase [Rikenellaceae bacterium]